MKKRFLQFEMTAKAVMIGLLLGVAGITKINAQVGSFEVNYGNYWLEYYFNYGTTTVNLYHYYNGSGEGPSTLTIPSTVTYHNVEYTIVEIGEAVFQNSNPSSITSIIIPETVTKIGWYAFQGCNNLTNIFIPESVTTIGLGAFYECGNLTNITIPETVTTIGQEAFYGTGWYNNQPEGVLYLNDCCLGYKGNQPSGDLSIQEGTRLVAEYAFIECYSLSSVTIPNSVFHIGSFAFFCTSISEITLSNSLTSVEDNVFHGCNFLTSIDIPNSVTSIGMDAFSECMSLTNISIPNSVTIIDSRAFSDTNIQSLVLPNSLQTIGGGAFSCCFNLKGSLVIPNSVTSIYTQAFHYCDSITSITIGNSVSYIGFGAFNCSSLTSIVVLNETPPSLSSSYYNYSGVFESVNKSIPIYVPYGTIDSYMIAPGWNEFTNYQEIAYKFIQGHNEGDGNWQFIASPLSESITPTEIDDMILTAGTYDLYRFDQTEDAEWRNYKANNFNLENGHGYLYANAEDVNLIFKGTFNEDETKNVGLVYDANAYFAGWNLVGNPFPVSAYANKSYYTMNDDGSAIEPVAVSMETAIPACTGVMVKAENTGESVTFSKTAPETQGQNNGSLQIAVAQANIRGASTSSAAVLDKAIVSFNEGDELGKFVFNKGNAKLYIPQGNEDYAIACAEKQGEMPLNFEATENGEYTISIKAENAEFDYLHLIDNLTGTDIDLLPLCKGSKGDSQPATYTFTAKTTDYASRFRLVFSVSGDADGDDDAPFAFISNGSIIVSDANADATLQIVDMTGHIIVSVDVARNISTKGMAQGVYVLRLIKGDEVKTQRIVIE